MVATLSLALRSAVALEGNSAAPGSWTLSTQHLALTFGERGVVSAVVDRATNRNLVLPAGGPQQSLISAVFGVQHGKAAELSTACAARGRGAPRGGGAWLAARVQTGEKRGRNGGLSTP